jgi:hypothetical protein
MTVTVKVEGVARLKGKLKKYSERQMEILRQEMHLAGLLIQRESQIICPVDTGALRNSARTTTVLKKGQYETTVTYSTTYAIFVHERLDLAHRPPTQAKFLETAYLQNKDAVVARIALKLKQG